MVEKAKADVVKHRPRHVHASPPCTHFSQLKNANQKTEAQREKLVKQKRNSRKILRNVSKLNFLYQK